MSKQATAEAVQVRFVCCTQKLTSPSFDREGFLICPEHHERRYGWLSPRLRPEKAYPFDPAKPEYVNKPDWSESHIDADRAIVDQAFPGWDGDKEELVEVFIEGETLRLTPQEALDWQE